MKPKKRRIRFSQTNILRLKWMYCYTCGEEVKVAGETYNVRCGTCTAMLTYDDHEILKEKNLKLIKQYNLNRGKDGTETN